MELKDIKTGMNVRYENQKWKGTVKGVNEAFNMAYVVFEGDGALEEIDAGYLRPL